MPAQNLPGTFLDMIAFVELFIPGRYAKYQISGVSARENSENTSKVIKLSGVDEIF